MSRQNWELEHPQYTKGSIADSVVPKSPWILWATWQNDASHVMQYTNEIAVSTCGINIDGEMQPTVRMVLLKYCDERTGFCWYSKAESEKGIHLAQYPRTEILWYVRDLQRQVRVRGEIHHVSREEAVVYAQSRPRKSQISAFISRQSQPVHSRATLEKEFADADATYKDISVPVSNDWVGYVLRPVRFEFWQGRADRLHDRIMYRYDNGLWRITRLYP